MKPIKKDIKKEKIINWYEKLKDEITPPTKLDKNFNMHHILPNSMILAIGGTGTGKTNSLMSFLSFKNDSFYKIILYTGSTGEEPLYQYLKQKIASAAKYVCKMDTVSVQFF